uniref:Uncharacterized protein n=1 Tax=Cairina moschata TaxID=8855 RepID=A0A8C3CIH8_CAIMO
PPQPVRLPWHWASLSLGVLSLLLLLVQVILVGLSFHCEYPLRPPIQQPPDCQFCPAGWMGDAGRCYYFSSAKKSWEQSKDDCCSRGAQLATRDSSRFEWKWLDGTLMRG